MFDILHRLRHRAFDANCPQCGASLRAEEYLAQAQTEIERLRRRLNEQQAAQARAQ